MLQKDFQVINIGLDLITEAIPSDRVTQLAWQPPAFGEAQVARLATLIDDEVTREANAEAIARVHAVRPQLIDVQPAGKVIPDFTGKKLLHAGPPIELERVCNPVRGAFIGAILFEGWAQTEDEAQAMLNSGEVTIEPCHHYQAVGPMAGVLCPSMPVFVVTDGAQPAGAAPRFAYSSMNEGLGKVLRFGAYDAEVIERLTWLKNVFGPSMSQALKAHGPLDVNTMFAQALMMGDEGHNRNVAATSLLTRKLAPYLSRTEGGEATLGFLAQNDHFALNLSMAAAKLALEAAAGVQNSSLVITMARNGVEFGLRLASMPDRWFTCEVGPADGLFFPGYSIEDANPDLGDSAITETLGIGGFAMAASPAITRFVGGTPMDALKTSIQMGRITLAEHPVFQLPALNFAGSPSGIDALKVLETNVLPVINTGIAHKQAGIGQIGAGIVHAPKQVFLDAVQALAAKRQQ